MSYSSLCKFVCLLAPCVAKFEDFEFSFRGATLGYFGIGLVYSDVEFLSALAFSSEYVRRVNKSQECVFDHRVFYFVSVRATGRVSITLKSESENCMRKVYPFVFFCFTVFLGLLRFYACVYY